MEETTARDLSEETLQKLKQNKIITLNLMNKNIGVEGIRILSEVLKVNQSLQLLDLGGNK